MINDLMLLGCGHHECHHRCPIVWDTSGLPGPAFFDDLTSDETSKSERSSDSDLDA